MIVAFLYLKTSNLRTREDEFQELNFVSSHGGLYLLEGKNAHIYIDIFMF